MTSRNPGPGTAAAPCLACGEPLPTHDPGRAGRKARYCSGACKARAYRARRQPSGPAGLSLPAGARYARAAEIRQQASDLIASLADTASGQQALFTTARTTRQAQPAQTARTLHRLVTELAALATAAALTKRATKHRPPETSPLFGKGAEWMT